MPDKWYFQEFVFVTKIIDIKPIFFLPTRKGYVWQKCLYLFLLPGLLSWHENAPLYATWLVCPTVSFPLRSGQKEAGSFFSMLCTQPAMWLICNFNFWKQVNWNSYLKVHTHGQVVSQVKPEQFALRREMIQVWVILANLLDPSISFAINYLSLGHPLCTCGVWL